MENLPPGTQVSRRGAMSGLLARKVYRETPGALGMRTWVGAVSIMLMVSACRREDPAPADSDSAQAVVADSAIHPDSVASCFTADGSVLARSSTAPSINGWIRLERFASDSSAATLVDSDGFALDATWFRRADSVMVSGFNDFVRIDMRLSVSASSASGTLRAHSDAALERDSSGRLVEFRRSTDIRLRKASCDSMPARAGKAAIDVLPHGTPRPGIRFDPGSLKRGVAIGTLVVDSITARQTVVDSSLVGMARFKGEIQLSGWTLRNPDPDLYRQLTCFEADSSSAARLPRWQGDERRAWFCFSNRAEAARALGPPSEGLPFTIVIDEFTIHRGMSDEVNSARFIRLVRSGAPE